MKKILFFSAALVAMVFMALSFNSCKKEKSVATPTSLDGTQWKYSIEEGGVSGAEVYSFSATTYTIETYVDGVMIDNTNKGNYEYSDGKGTLDKNTDSETSFTVSGNTLTLYPGTAAATAYFKQ